MLGPYQLQIMEYLWDKSEAPNKEEALAKIMPGYRASASNRRLLSGASAHEIWEALIQRHGATAAGSISTCRTILKRLVEQNKIEVISGVCGTTTSDPVYLSAITRDRYKETSLKEMLEEGRDHGIGTEELINHLVKTGHLKTSAVKKATVKNESK